MLSEKSVQVEWWDVKDYGRVKCLIYEFEKSSQNQLAILLGLIAPSYHVGVHILFDAHPLQEFNMFNRVADGSLRGGLWRSVEINKWG